MMNTESFNLFVKNLIRDSGFSEPLILLSSQLKGHPSSRFSIFAMEPDVTIQADGLNITLNTEGQKVQEKKNPWEALKEIREKFPGWYVGFLGYDLKNHIEDLKSENRDYVNAPDLYFFRPQKMLLYDHWKQRLVRNSGFNLNTVSTAPVRQQVDLRIENLQSVTPEKVYLDKIYAAKERIREGDFYEINLSHIITGTVEGSGFELYEQMRKAGPVPFGAYMKWDDFEICSASPERFLCRDADRVFSQPIKGTAARNYSPAKDQEIARQLQLSEKNRAENLMIVDLVRHDLSKVATPGSIKVPELFQLQSFKTVHQLISTIEGRVKAETDSVDVLKSCFPMGSMTGAPKIRAMQAIEEFEDYKRGIYSGAIGYIKPDGDFDFNVVIRSAILKNGNLYYPVGGAITSDSDPVEELEETYIKTRALTMIPDMYEDLK